MFSYADGMTMSAKKDAIVNMGGFIATRHQDWYDGAKGYCVQFEGYLTYGGMNGRDMNALAIGLDENTEFDNLETRIKQVQYLASRLDEFGILVWQDYSQCLRNRALGLAESNNNNQPAKFLMHLTAL